MGEVPEGWQFAARVDDMPESGIFEAVFGQTLILVVKFGDGFTAVQGLCPHQAARLKDGRLDAEGFIHCPRHMAKFDLRDGECAGGWVLPPLMRYAVRIVDGDVLLPDPLTPIV